MLTIGSDTGASTSSTFQVLLHRPVDQFFFAGGIKAEFAMLRYQGTPHMPWRCRFAYTFFSNVKIFATHGETGFIVLDKAGQGNAGSAGSPRSLLYSRTLIRTSRANFSQAMPPKVRWPETGPWRQASAVDRRKIFALRTTIQACRGVGLTDRRHVPAGISARHSSLFEALAEHSEGA